MSDFSDIIRDGFTEAGLSPEAAGRLTGFVDVVSRHRLVSMLIAIRATVHGTAILRALGDDGSEALREAARRLRCSPGSLHRMEAQYRRLLYDD